MIDQLHVSEGTTLSERYLTSLAKKSFLSLWCYSNIFTDERRKNEKGDGQELCDLLVVFKNHILIFSVRDCKFQNGVDEKLAWSRWYRKAIKRSALQIIGACNWIKKYPDHLFLDSSCQYPFPLKINPIDCRFHLIAVTRGSNSACNNYLGRKSIGSLQINTIISNDEHAKHPFTIGRVFSEEDYIHVFDEFSLEVAMQELDTINDFVDYLEKKEKLLTHPTRHIKCDGEEQLIAIYMTSGDILKPHGFEGIPDNTSCEIIDVGFWEIFKNSHHYKAKKAADAKSYTWDRFIEYATEVSQIRYGENGENLKRDISEIESVLRILASEKRIIRRQLSEKLLDAKLRNRFFVRFGYSEAFEGSIYVFLTLPCPQTITDFDEYCEFRRLLLEAYCVVCLSKRSLTQRVIGIASEPVNSQSFPEQGFNEDMFFQEFLDTEKQKISLMAEMYSQVLKEMGFGVDELFNGEEITENEYEYPVMCPTNTKKVSPATRLIEKSRIRNLKKLEKK